MHLLSVSWSLYRRIALATDIEASISIDVGKSIQWRSKLIPRIDSSSKSSSLSSSLSSVSSSVASAHVTAATSSSSTVSTSVTAAQSSSLSPEQEAEQVREKIDSDLKTWQEKVAKAADKGTEDLEERVKEITGRQVASQVQGVGEALVVQLEESAKSELSGLKSRIIKIVHSLPQKPRKEDLEKAESDLSGAIRTAGLAVKGKAQALRSWKQDYNRETLSLITAASESTLQVVDNIRDLGLQEIGMRWAWMEGVTYKDWSRYHALKETFDEWSSEIEKIAKDHQGLKKAKEAGDDVESRGMAVAEEAAKELGRLKEVGKWKIHAQDSSHDFSKKHIPAAAASAGQKVLDKANEVSEGIYGASQGTLKSIVSGATESIVDAASRASSKVVGTEADGLQQAATKISEAVSGTKQPVHESVASVASDNLQKGASKASEAAMGTEQPMGENVVSVASSKASQAASVASDNAEGFTTKFVDKAGKASAKASEAILGTQQPKAESVVSVANKKMDQAASSAKEAIVGTPAPLHESIASKASSSGKAAASAVSEAFVGTSTPVAGSISSATSSASSAASSVASKASKKIWGGAMAQKVKGQTPILEDIVEDTDDASYSEKLQSMVSEAGDRYTDVTRAVSEALLKPSSTQGSVESITSIASEQYASAIAAASSVLYGTQKSTGESIVSAASSRYADAVSA